MGGIGREERRRVGKVYSHDVREKKIATFRRNQLTKKRINALKEKIERREKEKRREGKGEWEEGGERASEMYEMEDEETETRELLLLQLQMSVRDSLEEMSLISQEIQLLHHMKSLQEREVGERREENVPSSGSISIGSDQRERRDKGSSEGITVTRLSKTPDGQILSTREQVKSSVFRPRMSAPTMSLEEFGELEYARAMERGRREQEREASTDAAERDSRNYNQLVADGDEDNEELVDAAVEKDRRWDAWKEESSQHWRGAGNKANKRY